jgi:TPP-dependent indolepyruvate ferredoxin oxidoreductase alpha subunit
VRYDLLALLETAAAFTVYNLTVVVLDNECYGETGGQASLTVGIVDFVGIAKSRGISDAGTLVTMAEVAVYAAPLQHVTVVARFASIKIDPANLSACWPTSHSLDLQSI